jgi:AcrR family transcriptional regulator
VEERSEMEERARRIVETAVALAEEGGFEAVRLRDVASHAGVALGTLYRRFRSKEDLLVAALDLETQAMARRLEQRPAQGADELERVVAFFRLTTRGLMRRPNLARAMVKAAASGDPELAKQVASFHERVEKMIVAAMRGPNVPSTVIGDAGNAGEVESRLAYHLNMYWFALMVGWSGGLHSQHDVIEGMKEVTDLLLWGAGRKASGQSER